MEDNLIIRKVKDGDSEAFSAVVEKHHRGLLNFIYRLVGDESIVEDIGQDVFLDVYKSLNSFDESRGTPFSAWLYVAARNRCISELRKRRRTLPVFIEDVADFAADMESAEDLLVEKERRQVVGRFLGQLSEPFRLPLLMSLEGSSLREIAGVCGISQGTAKSRLSRAKEKMRLLVKQYFGGGNGYERV